MCISSTTEAKDRFFVERELFPLITSLEITTSLYKRVTRAVISFLKEFGAQWHRDILINFCNWRIAGACSIFNFCRIMTIFHDQRIFLSRCSCRHSRENWKKKIKRRGKIGWPISRPRMFMQTDILTNASKAMGSKQRFVSLVEHYNEHCALIA